MSDENNNTPPAGQETLRLLAMGSPEVVNSTIRTLYLLGYADISEWSPLQPTAREGQVMSIMTRRFPKQ